jgi:enoyl-[acyl-carrier protein] reductase II
MLAAMVLGADGVQMGSRFVASKECSAHINFKNKVVSADEGETDLTLKELTAVRLMKNEFYTQIQKAYQKHATHEELKELLGRGRAKKGMFEGNLVEGELEIGQVSSMIKEIMPAADIMHQIIEDFEEAAKSVIEYRL